MRRREFIAGLGGAAAWPLAARAQQGDRMRRIGVLMNGIADDPLFATDRSVLLQGLQQFGWTEGRNVRIDYRFGAGDAESSQKYAAELLALAPDVILASGASTLAPLLRATRSVPIVFVIVSDPVGGGFVESLARPGGNATGFSQFEFGFGAKWLELLKLVAPGVRRVAILWDPTLPAGLAQFGAIQSAASSVEVSPVDVRDAADIERGIDAFALGPNGGLIVVSNPTATVHRKLIVTLAARHRLPAVYPFRYWVTDGGLISYGPDLVDQFRLAAGYVDRILKGAKPEDLPVVQSTKFELVINLKTAKTLGVTVPETLLATADEVIE
jgi:putative tryptophan/tyrosine transport system substrate-binding protein